MHKIWTICLCNSSVWNIKNNIFYNIFSSLLLSQKIYRIQVILFLRRLQSVSPPLSFDVVKLNQSQPKLHDLLLCNPTKNCLTLDKVGNVSRALQLWWSKTLSLQRKTLTLDMHHRKHSTKTHFRKFSWKS